MRRWCFGLLLLLWGCGARQIITPSVPQPLANVNVIVGRNHELWRFSGLDQTWSPLTNLAPSQVSSQPSLSPDRTMLVFSQTALPTPTLPNQAFVITQTNLALMPSNGGTARVLLEAQRSDPNQFIFDSVETPIWSSDGMTIYATYHTLRFTRQNVFLADTNAIISVDPTSGITKTLINDGRFPAIAPDGHTLAFIRTINNTPHIFLYDLASKQEKLILRSLSYSAIEAPVWSEDSTTLYFAANALPISGQSSWFDWVLADSAQAHGSNWKIVALDVSKRAARELQQQIFEDPRILVYPDHLLVWAASGLWQIKRANPQEPAVQLLQSGGIGGITKSP